MAPQTKGRPDSSDHADPAGWRVIGAFYEVYNTLGCGFLEHVYIRSLEWELLERGHHVAREVGVPVHYKAFEVAYQRLDMVVDGKLIVETKSTFDLPKAAQRQLYNYLRATTLEVGLLLHFGPEAKYYRLYCPKRSSAQSAESDASG